MCDFWGEAPEVRTPLRTPASCDAPAQAEKL